MCGAGAVASLVSLSNLNRPVPVTALVLTSADPSILKSDPSPVLEGACLIVVLLTNLVNPNGLLGTSGNRLPRSCVLISFSLSTLRVPQSSTRGVVPKEDAVLFAYVLIGTLAY